MKDFPFTPRVLGVKVSACRVGLSSKPCEILHLSASALPKQQQTPFELILFAFLKRLPCTTYMENRNAIFFHSEEEIRAVDLDAVDVWPY